MMTLFYAPLQQMLKLFEEIRHLYSYVILVLFVCVGKTTVLMLVWDGETEMKIQNMFRW